MSNLVEHAKKELEFAGLFDKDGDYDGMLGDACLELIETFSKQGHSGMSASVVRCIFNKLANFEPLTALSFNDDEWAEPYAEDDGVSLYQNKRKSTVFKHGKDGKPYYIDAYYLKNQKGSTYSGSLTLPDGKSIAKCYIKDANNMPTICIDVIDREVNGYDESIDEPDSGCWVYELKDPSQIKEIEKYYELGLSGEPDYGMKCPKCGGEADNGHDRCFPHNAYHCTKCSPKKGGE